MVYAAAFDSDLSNGIFRIADQVAAAISAHLSHSAAQRPPAQSSQMLTSNLGALQAYLEGKRLIARFRMPEARSSLRSVAAPPLMIDQFQWLWNSPLESW